MRIDVLLKNEENKELIVVEIKKGMIGKDAYKQICGYINEIKPKAKSVYGMDRIRGIIICNGVLPAFEDFYYDQKDIEVKIYAWKFSFRQF